MRTKHGLAKHGLALSSVALIAMMLFPSLAEATTIVTRYPPYAYSEMTTERGGWLKSGYAKIYRAETDRDTGYMYVHMKAMSVIWIAHHTKVYFEMTNTHRYQSVYVPKGATLKITVKIRFKGSMRGYGNTGKATLTVKIRTMAYEGGSVQNPTQTVQEYDVRKGVILSPGLEYFVAEFPVLESGYFASGVKLYCACYSGNSGGAWMDFGSEDNYIRLYYIQYMW